MKTISTSCILFLIVSGFLQAQTVIPLGEGSIASVPPDGDNLRAFLSHQPLLGPDARSRPLPTNDWWTTLLTESSFPGILWQMPFAIEPTPEGLNLYQPQGWSEGGNELKRGLPLQISGIPEDPRLPGNALMLFDFEDPEWSREWKVTGEAFGPGPMPGSRHGAAHLQGRAYACSFWEGDGGTGTLTSPRFPLNRDYMHLKISGGNDADRLGVELLVNDQVVYKAVGDQSNTLRALHWDLREWKGQSARLRLVDTHTGGWGFIAADAVMLSDEPTAPVPGIFQRCSTLDWGDWSVRMGMHAAGTQRFEVTLVRGMPLLWIEADGITPKLSSEEKDRFLDVAGNEVRFPFAGSPLIVERDQKLFGLYQPNGFRWERDGSTVILTGAGLPGYLAVAALPEVRMGRAFAAYAHTLPTDTQFDWEFQPRSGEVVTRWTVQTRSLNGAPDQGVLQGWLPHHWRNTRHDLDFFPVTYETQRGPMRLARGNPFILRYRFTGLPIALPLQGEGMPSEQKSEVLRSVLPDQLTSWIKDAMSRPHADRSGADTYWGGKKVLALATTATLSEQTGHPLAGEALEMLRETLNDWTSYTPGETERYFARYGAPWNGLVGFRPSYGSETFSDCHFHHGYFTLSAALLARLDPDWARSRKQVLQHIAKQYGNWNREDADFPFLRTFSPWVGHSYAGGSSNPGDGNNQESTSESMMAWAGLFLLGAALEDDGMRDAGAMGLAIEQEAVREYWNDLYHWQDPTQPQVFSDAYRNDHTIVGVRRDRDMGYWTWFSGEAIHIYGIQWLPTWTHLQYLGADPEFVAYQHQEMMKRQGASDMFSLGRDWGHVALSHLIWGNPDQVGALLNRARTERQEVGDWRNGGVTLAMSTSLQTLGTPLQDAWSSLPTSAVYRAVDGTVRWTGWNPGSKPVEVEVTLEGTPVTTFSIPPGPQIQVKTLTP